MSSVRFRLFLLAFLSGYGMASAVDIVTLSGKKYYDVHDVQIRGNLLTFTTATDIVKVPLSDVPPALRNRYQPKNTPPPVEAVRPQLPPAAAPAPSSPGGAASSAHDLVVNTGNKYLAQMAADLQAARTSAAATYPPASAFSVAQLDAARKDALANGRPVAFFMVDDTLLGTPCLAKEASARGAFAHFFQVFSRSVTPVFIVPSRDLAQLPGVLSTVLAKPASVAAPRVVFTNSEITETLHDLTLATARQTIAQREEAIYPAVGMIKRWYVKIANSVP